MRKYILAWKRRCVDVRAGTQAPPLRFRLGDCAQTVGVVWADCTWPVDAVWVDCMWTVGIVPALFRLYASAHSLFMLFISAAFIFSMDSDEGIQKNGIFVPSL